MRDGNTDREKTAEDFDEEFQEFSAESGAAGLYGVREQVREVLVLGRRRVEKEMMLMLYRTGLLINEDVRFFNEGCAA